MRRILLAIPILCGMALAFLLLALAPAATSAPAGTAAAGKAFWDAQWCSRCHGANGEGGYGPDLAGRGLNFQHFARAVRQPWGVMPAYTARQVSDQTVADLVEYFKSLPAVAEPGPQRTTVSASAPEGQRLIVRFAGCGQCHGDVLGTPRRAAGGAGADFAWFEENVYEHAQEFHTGRMGSYSRDRIPEDTLRTIWTYISQDLGLRVPVTAALAGAAAADGKVTYTLTFQNTGVAGKGLAAGNLYIAMLVPAGSSVASASTSGYQGVQRSPSGSDVAIWLAPRAAAQEKLTFSITVTGSGAAGGSQAFVRWLSPTRSATPGVVGDYVQTALVPPTTEVKASPASVAQGGQLYDKWWKVIAGAVEPKDNSPLWATQTTNTRAGADTWRCKECHGWDYKGKDGAYGSGSHKTGFVGVLSAASTRTRDQLVGILKGSANSNHNFSSRLGDDGIGSLADFLKESLIDEVKYIDYSTKKPIGSDANRGRELFGRTCAACHGADGAAINFGSAAEPEYVGTVASDNPWEFVHKVRFGQPGTAMPAGVVIGWTIQDVVDVLAHAQSLKSK